VAATSTRAWSARPFALVARSQPEIKYPQISGNPSEQQLQKRTRAAVLRAPLSAWLPTYRITEGGTTSSHTVECGQGQAIHASTQAPRC